MRPPPASDLFPRRVQSRELIEAEFIDPGAEDAAIAVPCPLMGYEALRRGNRQLAPRIVGRAYETQLLTKVFGLDT